MKKSNKKRYKISDVYQNSEYTIIPPEEIAKTNERIRKAMKELSKKYKF